MISLNVNGLNDRTKRHAVFTRIRESKADICLLQETHATDKTINLWSTEWEGPMMASNGTQGSRGVIIMCDRNLSFTTTKRLQDESGRILALDLHIANTTYSIISLYAPTQDKLQEQVETLEKVEQMLMEMDTSNIIIGGDFNCIMNPDLDKNTSKPCHPAANITRSRIETLRDEWTLTNVWRVRNPGKRGYTFQRGNYSSRLDMLLISSHLSEVVKDVKIQTLVHSDHALISCSLRPTKEERRPGLWRFDPALLTNEDFVADMSDFLTGWSAPDELLDPNSIWDWMKHEIRCHIRTFTKNIHSSEKQHISSLHRELKELYQKGDEGKDDLALEIEATRRELKEIEEAKARQTIFHSRCNWSLYGERPSKYFLNLKKRKRSEGRLHEIIGQDGSTLTNIPDILKEGHKFYEDLYSSREDTLLPVQTVSQEMRHIDRPQLSDITKESLERPFSQAELKEALSHLNSGKCPGTDGLTPEFFLAFWNFLAPFFCKSLEFSIQTGTMSTSQRRGVITLIPKKDLDRRLIANRRPITLLNTDYKIYSKAIAIRLQRVMGPLIHCNQTAFMRGRLIGDSIRLIKDSLRKIQISHPHGMIIALDFKKAFDSVRWDLIVEVLKWFNFGEHFIYIEIMFRDIETCLSNSGYTSHTSNQVEASDRDAVHHHIYLSWSRKSLPR